MELSHYEDNGDAIREMFGQKPENYLDVICDYLEAGLVEDALYVVELSRSHYPLLHYYRATASICWVRTEAKRLPLPLL